MNSINIKNNFDTFSIASFLILELIKLKNLKLSSMNTEKSIKILNQFLTLQNERFEDFEINILETIDPDLKSLFYKYQKKCHECKLELIAEIIVLGGNPMHDSLSSKKFFHLWLDFKNVFKPTNREDLIPVCEYKEFVTIKNFNNLLYHNIKILNFRHIQILNKQLIIIQKNHDELKILSDGLLTPINRNNKGLKLETLQTFNN